MLSLPGLQIRPLREGDHLGLGGRPSVVSLEGRCQFVAAVVDLPAARRPAGSQRRVDAADLADGKLPTSGVSLDERQPECLHQIGLKRGGVELGGGDLGLVQQVGVKRVPVSIGGLHLVGHDEVRVQVRVTGTGVAMGERDGDQPARLDIADAVRTDAAERLGFEVLDHLGDGPEVQLLQLLAVGDRGERPESRERLRRRHGQVDARDGDRFRTRPDRDGTVQLDSGVGHPSELLGEELAGDLSADLGEDVGVELGGRSASVGDVCGGVAALELLLEPRRSASPDGEGTAEAARLLGIALAEAGVEGVPSDLVGEWVQPVTEQRLHLVLGDRVTGIDAQSVEAGAHPHARRLALLLVVGREPGPERRVLGGDLSGEVVIAGAGGHLLQADRHHSPPLQERSGHLP